MNANEFISYLESRQLLESVILDQLRKLISSTQRAITPEELVKLLVDQGHLTRFQGSRMLAELPEADDGPDPPDELAIKHVDSLDGEVHVTPEPDPQPVAEEPIVDLTSSADEDEEIVDLEQAVAAPLPVQGNDPLLDPLAQQPVQQPVATASYATDGAGLEEEAGGRVPDHAPSTLAELQVASNPWDTKLIVLGIGSFGLLFVAAVFLYNSITAYPPMEMLSKAQEDYNAGSYTQSIAKYEKFLKKYPRHDDESLAQVRIGMCKINQVAKEPEKALDRCNEILPKLQAGKGIRHKEVSRVAQAIGRADVPSLYLAVKQLE